MVNFDKESLETAPHPPGLWMRYVDDTFVILEAQYKDEFFHHNQLIRWAYKIHSWNHQSWSVFIDTLVTPQSDGSLSTTVYRKATHINQYL